MVKKVKEKTVTGAGSEDTDKKKKKKEKAPAETLDASDQLKDDNKKKKKKSEKAPAETLDASDQLKDDKKKKKKAKEKAPAETLDASGQLKEKVAAAGQDVKRGTIRTLKPPTPENSTPKQSVVGEDFVTKPVGVESKASKESIAVQMKKKKLNTESSKYVGMEPEWNSTDLRNESLFADGFTCCIVMVIEESPDLTEYTQCLHQAVNTGIRRNFASIDGNHIGKKVQKFMTSSKLREAGFDDDSYMNRMDIWAEAIKQILLQYKSHAMVDIVLKAKPDGEITGARSKELITDVLASAFTGQELSSDATIKSTDVQSKGVEKNKSKIDLEKKKQKGGKKGKHTTVEPQPQPQSTTVDEKLNTTDLRKPKPTLLRKRGELPLPAPDFIEDTSPKGPHSFFLLQGFYNPLLIEELRTVGVPVDGILLMTSGMLEKRNFSVLDIEENVRGAFRPRNILPEYAKFMGKHSMTPDHDLVAQFWLEFTDMLNNAKPTSEIHDIALMNCPIPSLEPIPTGMEEKGRFAGALFDEASKRIYEMLVLKDWFQEYKKATRTKEVEPISEEPPSQDVYERLMDQVPAECVTVAVIVECMVEQVVATMDFQGFGLGRTKTTEVNPDSGSDVEWGREGYRNPGTSTATASPIPTSAFKEQLSLRTPLYIKSSDFASMRTCHLNENFAAHVASSQVCGDLHNIQSFLWKTMPDFNKGLYMKLLSNLNHFMHFLPPDMIKFEDLFFILHLLMASGVELYLQKKSETLDLTENEARKVPSDETGTAVLTAYSELENIDDVGYNKPSGQTNLQPDHNYLTIEESTNKRYIVTPSTTGFINMTEIGVLAEEDREKASTAEKENQGEEKLQLRNLGREQPDEELRKSVDFRGSNTQLNKVRRSMRNLILSHSIERVPSDPVDKVHAAVIATAGTLEDVPHNYKLEKTDHPTPPNTPAPIKSKIQNEDEVDGEVDGEVEGEDANIIVPLDQKVSGPNWGGSDGGKRFIACEEEWFNSFSDSSVLEALLKCPALLAINESGALDLSDWVETYLFTNGLSRAAGEGSLIGDLKNWNYVEEYVALQMIQILNAASKSYLCMERMYCPFYDTLLFIFNNPTPTSLKADSQYYFKLKTLPGLQHFLEYTINDTNVLDWLLELEQNKGVGVADSFSVTTLMRLVPEEQWMLIPSIKYTILREQKEKERQERQLAGGDIPLTDEGEDQGGEELEAEEEFGKLKRESILNTKSKIASKSAENTKSNKRKSKIGAKSQKIGGKVNENPANNMSLGKINKKSGEDLPNTSTDQGEGENKKSPTVDTKDETAENLESLSFSFNNNALNESMLGLRRSVIDNEMRGNKFNCYDLGKRVLITEADVFHLFPMDGTCIKYEICTIDPDFRMMQLSITKNSHQSFFYPYYIPNDLDLSGESYVVCPYFHFHHANGTIYAFQDLRNQDAPYIKFAMRQNYPQPGGVFSIDDIYFAGSKYGTAQPGSAGSIETGATEIGGAGSTPENIDDQIETGYEGLEEDMEMEDGELEGEQTTASADVTETKDNGKTKGKKEKGKGKKEKMKEKEEAEKAEKKKKGKKGKKTKGGKQSPENTSSDIIQTMEEEMGGEWEYPSSENTEAEEEEGRYEEEFGELDEGYLGGIPGYDYLFESLQLKKEKYNFSWESADKLLEPMTHSFRITLPSGLYIKIEDVNGPPLAREVKQSYLAKGSSCSLVEANRYYTSNGSVVKFMLNKSIQILTARGVTTNIRELSINTDRDETEVQDAFAQASKVKVYNGDVILPTGEFWQVRNGLTRRRKPFYVFTSGVMPNGEIFRRRQDGVTYLHRNDGTVITHYPDGSRFTTRIVVLKDPVEEFEDWVFVGLKIMIEHPNFATVLFNTLSGNVHIRISPGEWVRVFADGSIKVGTHDEIKLDVDKYRAVIASPPCPVKGEKDTPNLVAIKLYHTPDSIVPPEEPEKPETSIAEEPLIEQPEEEEEEEEEAPATPQIPETRPSLAARKAKKKKEKPKKGGKNQKNSKSRNPSVPMEKNLRGSVAPTIVSRMSQTSMDRKRSARSISLGEADMAEEETGPGKVEESPVNPTSSSRKQLEIEGFLTFSDTWTICKAIDSWDNRFAVNIYGDTVVDKGEILKSHATQSREDLLRSLSAQFSLSKEFLSGILSTTSSEEFSTHRKRLQALIKPGSCNPLPKAKMFIVNRDLSGYEYLKKQDVDKMILSAKKCRESTCLIEPLPGQGSELNPRKLLTIMEPVEVQKDTPHGVWKSPYREPVFRPKLANKNLQLARPENLRWFGYILVSAHNRRPRFFLSPKEQYVNAKAGRIAKAKEEEMQRSELVQKSAQFDRKLSLKKQSIGDVESATSQPTLQKEDDKIVKEDMVAGKKKEVDGKKKKKEGKGKKDKLKKLDDDAENVNDKKDKKGKKKLGKADSREKKNSKDLIKGSKGSLREGSGSKHARLRKESGLQQTSEQNGISLDEGTEIERKTSMKEEPIEGEGDPEIKPKNSKIINLNNTEIGEYREDIPDIASLYGLEVEEENAIKAQFHPDPSPTKRAIVVRSIVEIPKVDDIMQRALLAASMSYSKTIDNHKKIYESYEMHDPRTEDEKVRQKLVKQQLIEKNLGELHLFEQKEGNLLHFNL